ncbi:MAG: putative transporter [Bacteroidales bacterium]|jgi:putative transport protein|nr:putative transporter [Bacteroidales bacterium]MDI9574933.1 putative transporter [Bacteroidota bacterium]MDD2593991.1 putative transporter [Bacteroidales bacterium]MDD3755194.1 putative transporter [Bacteroidales bacterium]MDY0400321.1 putative transporter [Bacteroidales bacterium]
MSFINQLLTGTSISHSIFILAIIVAIGLALGKIKIFGISLGVTWVLFIGIFLGHFGFTVDEKILNFVKDFGLILFVYFIGLQVGPSFFASLKKSGLKLNLLALTIVILGVIVTYILHLITGLPISTMTGILSGAVTNTPSMGVAQQTFIDMTGRADPSIALGYAVCYPLGILGVIFVIILLRLIFKIDLEKEKKDLEKLEKSQISQARVFSIQITNPDIFGKNIFDIKKLINKDFVISRVYHSDINTIEIAQPKTILNKDDKILVVTNLQNIDEINYLLGKQIEMDAEQWNKLDQQLISEQIIISNPKINGKTIGQLKLRSNFGVNVTRVNRAGFDLVASPNLNLQMGDRLTVVGTESAIINIEKFLGNSLKQLNEPNLIAIFIGIALGVLLGSIPLRFPGIPQPIKLGLAGGALIVAILLSNFGAKYHLVTYTTVSANLMIREIGISMFLASVGISVGKDFVQTIINGGYLWIAYGFIITIVPILIVGIIGRLVFKLNYFTLIGLITGSVTNPPALAFANSLSDNDAPVVSYSTVYPLTMFMRVITAQILILFFV